MVLRRLENQIVGGDGSGTNLTGILHTTGIASVAFAAGTPLADLALAGMTAVLQSEAEPNGVVMNPADRDAMLAAKASGSGVRLDSAGAFSPVPDTFFGLPLVTSTVMPQGQALVGDFAQGATLFVREGVNVRVSDSDQDDFIRNQVTLLGEGRFAVAIWRPACFALVHLA
jgi:HK97 family phage major capsid protein